MLWILELRKLITYIMLLIIILLVMKFGFVAFQIDDMPPVTDILDTIINIIAIPGKFLTDSFGPTKTICEMFKDMGENLSQDTKIKFEEFTYTSCYLVYSLIIYLFVFGLVLNGILKKLFVKANEGKENVEVNNNQDFLDNNLNQQNYTNEQTGQQS